MPPSPPAETTVELRRPTLDLLPGFVEALNRGWSPDNVRGKAAADAALELIEADPAAFVESLYDPEGNGEAIVLADGTRLERIPGYTLWIWDGDFCGSINFRWQPGTSALPAHVLGHIGYAVVPWKQGLGRASEALRLLLPMAWAQGLDLVELTTDADNLASQKVILNNGGEVVGLFTKPETYGGAESLRYRIVRPPQAGSGS